MADPRFITPYVPQGQYQRGSLGELLAQRGDIAARGELARGAAWANAIASIGQTASNAFSDYENRKRQAPIDAANLKLKGQEADRNQIEIDRAKADQKAGTDLMQYLGTVPTDQVDPKKIISFYSADPKKALDIASAFKSFNDMGKKDAAQSFKELPSIVRAVDHLDDAHKAALWPSLLDKVESSGIIKPGAFPKEWSPDVWASVKSAASELEPIDSNLTESDLLLKAAKGDPLKAWQMKQDAEKEKTAGKPETRSIDVQAAEALAKGDTATYQRLLKVKKDMGQADDKPGALKSVAVMDANGDTVLANYQASTGKYFDTAGKEIKDPKKPLGATDSNRAHAAEAVNMTGNDIVAKLSDPAFRTVVGPAMGRFNSLREFIGDPPPELSELAGEIESYALANMGVHGMRSSQGAEKINKMLDAKHTPESLAAVIKGLQGFSNNYLTTVGKGSKTTGSQKPGATPVPRPPVNPKDPGNIR